MDDLLNEFLVETSNRLVALDPEIRRFGLAPDDSAIQTQLVDLFHTIKGASGFLALSRLETIAEAGESLLAAIAAGEIRPTASSSEAIARAADTIRSILTALAAGSQEPVGDDSNLLSTLRGLANRESPLPEPMPPASIAADSAKTLASPVRIELETAKPGVSSIDATISSNVTVSAERLESLTDLVGQLVQSRNTLNHLMSVRDDSELEESVRQLSHIASDLGANVVTTRRQAWSAGERPGDFDIVTALTVACAGRRFAIPQRHVLELVWVTPSVGMGTANDEYRFLRLRDRRLPWIRLSTILGVEMDRILARRREIVVMMQVGDEAMGLSVEQVFDAEEIVVRVQPPILKPVALYSGNAILGDGSVAMVLEPGALLAELNRRQKKAITARPVPALPVSKP